MAIPGKENENGVYEFPYMIKPQQLSKWEKFKISLWNPSTKEILGRTGKSWFQLFLFYSIFYIVLAALFSICMVGLYATLDYDKPKYSNDNGLIGTNPGLGFRPIGDTDKGALIWYNAKDQNQTQVWVNLTKDFLKEYDIQGPGRDSKIAASCDYNQKPAGGLACPVNITQFGPCNPPSFGYDTASPCVFLKLNKIYGWIPEYYNTSAEAEKDKLPKDIVEIIKVNEGKPEANQVWIHCHGEREADKEHVTDFKYYPSRGFPSYYYPYQHKKNEYLSPIIAVQLINITAGPLVNIECRAWAKNIKYMGGAPEQRMGSVHFEIMRDDFTPNKTTTASKSQ